MFLVEKAELIMMMNGNYKKTQLVLGKIRDQGYSMPNLL